MAYLSTLAVSAGHLARWYALSLGDLPPWLAWGLAGSLEFTAFLLSLLSNSLLRGSAWAAGGAVGALGLVWLGNALSMQRAAPGLPLWEVLAGSLFVPVGTYVAGKVVGELLRAPREERVVHEPDRVVHGVDLPAPERVLDLKVGCRGGELVHVLNLRGPVGLNALTRELGWPKTSTYRWLKRLEAQGLVRRTGDGWEVVRGA